MGSGEKKYGARTKGIGKYIVVGVMIVVFVAFAIWAYMSK